MSKYAHTCNFINHARWATLNLLIGHIWPTGRYLGIGDLEPVICSSIYRARYQFISLKGLLVHESTEPAISSETYSLKSEFKSQRIQWLNSFEECDEATDALKGCDGDIYPNIQTLLQILATIPVTTCDVERTNSKLRLINTRMKSTTAQDRLGGLMLLNIRTSQHGH